MSSTIAGAAPGTAQDPDATRTLGRYVLLAPLGAGTTGEVFSAEDPGIGRRVAIKLLRIPDGLSPVRKAEWERRFLLEAKAAGRLSHPGIVSIYDVGTAPDGRPFIVMELVEGQSLDTLRRAASPPSFEQVVDLTIQVAEALDAAHRRGVVHRDVKPANILVDADGRARIADFGIAHLSESELTREGIFLGSPAFAAPEQIRGGGIDGRSDLFSLGAVFYTLATGKRPFEGDDIATIAYAVCHTEPVPPSVADPSVPRGFDAVVLRALAKEPLERFRTGAEMAKALRAAAAGEIPEGARPKAAPVERTVVGAPAPARLSTTAEDRAASVASATAVSLVRAGRLAARGADAAWRLTCRAALGIREKLRAVDWPAVLRSKRTKAALVTSVIAAAIALAFVAGRHRRAESEPESKVQDFVAQLRSLTAGKSARIGVHVEHGLEQGTLEIWADGNRVLREALSASKKELLGVPFLKVRSGEEESTLRLPPGEHEIVVTVTGAGDTRLAGKMRVDLEPKGEYRLDATIKKFPWSKLDLDWVELPR